MELSNRQGTLLALIVREYVDHAAPISSNGIREKYGLPFSPATIRNEMTELTEQGFIRQPHTSAGRVPTEEGYRYFVQQLLGEVSLPTAEQNTISHQFYQARGDVNHSVRLAASVISHHTRGAALVTAPRSQAIQFKHVELIATHGRQILLVVVLSGGEVRQQLLTLAEPVGQETLSETAKRLNAQLPNLDAEGIHSAANRYPTFEQEIARVIADSLSRESTTAAGNELVLEGMSNVLAEPEFADTQTARQTQKILAEQTFLQSFLSKVLTSNVGSVQVIIGGEGDWEELKDCSMVLARYGINNVATGALGVVGPTRMAYGRAISTVRYVAELMTDLVTESYGEH